MNMTRAQFDGLMGQVLEQHPDVADVIITTGKAIQAEVHGELKDAVTTPDLGRISPLLTKAMALALIGENARLQKALPAKGSCDLSYALPGKGRFRVNIFSQRGSLALVMRRLPSRIPGMEELGLPQAFLDMVPEKNGLILVTGGTGSGKSNSLAALIDRINETRAGHIVTLEDPVEYRMPTVRQVQLNRKAGMTFASGLRSILRQDPDVILVGEVRDGETAAIAVQAGLTGHRVLTTLHTNDAATAITRLVEMGIQPFLVSTVLLASVSQRLLRKNCPHCLESYTPRKDLLMAFGISDALLPKFNFQRGAGCRTCHQTGYSGRMAIYEVLQDVRKAPQKLHHIKEAYEAGLSAYRARRWTAAKKMFGKVIEAYGDEASEVFIHRIEVFEASPPPEDWDGVFRMKVK